ncbi:3-oxoadipate:succinyl-CoA transferase [Burkholderia mallei]|uniref:3-oxoadipate:succinyl-CoA transferase n=3 Tax=pseudomallei group TaxID=111527 RepID=A0AAX1X3B7_BURML|nr:3-oxoadipate CoA-succinyl transferase alpha subunit [Burkholderia pseudomallei 1106a]ARK51084.1 3-oxoadipate:succinyl-CoA transferase [Burkholderia pseudomallei]PNX00522.1 3-oxoadipate:succinyl-CoA transferase [Burkholderia sp. 136(2017)]PNX16708.1 3-oxoadipate:succinyl-CoA transferase [Burkholderia sp. 129]PNX27286.1 3-oxoadipate:succinyl-CoA transferase [Burkholderia sp. 117]PNX35922.1 3-oxoadipate:succinyl-CoA transferase [Burkholderia sp. 137]RKN93048.1 3-oxoadipate:succinyl-CoA transf
MYFCVLCRIRRASYPFTGVAAHAANGQQKKVRRRGSIRRACLE